MNTNKISYLNVTINLAALPANRPKFSPEFKRHFVDSLWFGPQFRSDELFHNLFISTEKLLKTVEEWLLVHENLEDFVTILPRTIDYPELLQHYDGSSLSLIDLNDLGFTSKELAFIVQHVF